MKILVTGAAGFIGSGIVERLLSTGHRVLACARDGGNLPGSPSLEFQRTDLSGMLATEDWLPLLDDVGAVVNVAGILREQRAGDFDRIHYQAPLALGHACVLKGIRRFVQISALGHPDDGPFVASKHRLDQALLAMQELDAIVLRPSVVVSLRGSYGGSSMLRAMASLPLVLVLPGDGNQKIQPLWLEDLAEMIDKSLTLEPCSSATIDAVGPEIVTLREFLLATRRWLRFPQPRIQVRVPMALVTVANHIGDTLRAGPLGNTTGRMLTRGNVSEDSGSSVAESLGVRPRSVMSGFEQSASFVQDRWQARLYPLIPIAWLALVVVWMVSALSGFLAKPEEYAPLLDQLAAPTHHQAVLVLFTSSLNLALALALATRRWIKGVLSLMLLSVLAYTLGLGLFAPEQWLAMTGGLVKNLAVLVLILFVMVLENRR